MRDLQTGEKSVPKQFAVSPDVRRISQKQPEREISKYPEQDSSARQACAITDQRRVLLAEDDDEMRSLLAWWLSKDGFEVTECDHGIDLINQIDPLDAALESEQFDLVISDIRMPGITGLDVLQDVRLCGLECPPVILITAFGDRKTHQQARLLGAAAIFDKPFDFNELLAKIHELVPKSSSPVAGINTEKSPTQYIISTGSCSVPGNQATSSVIRCYLDNQGGMFLVAHGIGGIRTSERAIQLVINRLSRLPREIAQAVNNKMAVETAIRKAFADANAEIALISDLDSRYYNVGSTVVMALLAGTRLYIAGLGADRAYLARNGQLKQLTRDHSWAQALLDEGVITADGAKSHRLRHVLQQYLGVKDHIEGPDVKTVELQPNDRLLLSASGLTNVVDDAVITQTLSKSGDPQEVADTLIQTAIRDGADDGLACVTLFVS
ncbi:MAG: response regulator [Pirellulales bacterium]|nr:response regulator [Pirellulales bacterium]